MGNFDDRCNIWLETGAGSVTNIDMEVKAPQDWEAECLMYACDVLRHFNNKGIDFKQIENNPVLITQAMCQVVNRLQEDPADAEHLYKLGLLCSMLYVLPPVDEKSELKTKLFFIKESLVCEGMKVQ